MELNKKKSRVKLIFFTLPWKQTQLLPYALLLLLNTEQVNPWTSNNGIHEIDITSVVRTLLKYVICQLDSSCLHRKHSSPRSKFELSTSVFIKLF
jgi:hypothetical protein